MSQRHAPRYEINVGVKVWGMDRYGKPFVQHARTVNANPLGARLSGIACVRVGEIIGIQHGDEKSRFKVVWVGRDNTPQARQIGVHCLEPSKRLFRAEHVQIGGALMAHQFPEPAASLQALSLAHSVRRPMAGIPPTRRKTTRYHCHGGVELRRNEKTPPIFASLSDISLEGCYIEVDSTLPSGTEVLFLMRVHDVQIRGRAIVKTSNHAVGMGLEFMHLATEDQQKLEFLVGTLSGTEEMLPHEQRRTVAEDPVRISQPFVTRPTAAMPAASIPQPSGPAPASSAMSQKVVRAVGDLNELEQNLVKACIDPRLIAQLHDAVEHVRQTAWTVQQWADLHSAGGDPFDVLPQLEAERMHMLRKLAHNVTADIDADSINHYTVGISELYETVEQLYRRLRRMLVEDAPG
jgi:hypothetical protein